MANITKCNKFYKLYKTHEIVKSLHIVNFVTNFKKIKFLKKCKKVNLMPNVQDGQMVQTVTKHRKGQALITVSGIFKVHR